MGHGERGEVRDGWRGFLSEIENSSGARIMGFWNGVVRLAPPPVPPFPPGARKDEFLFPHLEPSGTNPPFRLPFSRRTSV